MILCNTIQPGFPSLEVGQVVAYDYLHAEKTWQWTLGTVREIQDYTAIVQQWGLHAGDIVTLRSILLKELDMENGRMRNYQDMLGIAREKLASIRRSNEDHVSQVCSRFDAAREKLVTVDEVGLRKVTAQVAPSPVAVAVLKAVWAVVKCDPTPVEFYEWADVQLEYRKTGALDEIAKTDVLAKLYPSGESLQQYLAQDPKLNYKAAARDSPVVARLHEWVTTALAYQQAYSLLAHDERIQEQNDAIAAAIAGMKACRAKIAMLKDELSSKDTTTRPDQMTSFTRTSVLVTIPLSAVISPVSVGSDVEGCVLTKHEVEQILLDAKAMRCVQKQKLAITAAHLVEQYAFGICCHKYATELEERLSFLQHYMGNVIRELYLDAEGANRRLALSLQELEAFRQRRHDARQVRAAEPELAVADGVGPISQDTRSRSPAGRATPRGQGAAARGAASQQQQRTEAARQDIDPNTIANEPLYVVTIDEYKAKDAAGERAVDEAELLAADLQRLTAELEHAEREAERLAEELAARDEELAAYRQKRHDVQQARASDPALAAADAGTPRNGRGTSATPSSGRGAALLRGGEQQRKAVGPTGVPIDPAVIAEEPLYIVTAEELRDVRDLSQQAAREAESREKELINLTKELEADLIDARERNARLEDEIESLKERLSDAEEATKKATETWGMAEDERQQLCDDLEAALDELDQKRDDYDELLGDLGEVKDLLEASKAAGRTAVEALQKRNREIADLQGELAAALDISKENENLRALLDAKEREIDNLKDHNELWTDPVPTGKEKATYRFTKIFDGDWTCLILERPEALKAAFVIDASNACHVPGDQIGQVNLDHD